jgi:hypothetical protein
MRGRIFAGVVVALLGVGVAACPVGALTQLDTTYNLGNALIPVVVRLSDEPGRAYIVVRNNSVDEVVNLWEVEFFRYAGDVNMGQKIVFEDYGGVTLGSGEEMKMVVANGALGSVGSTKLFYSVRTYIPQGMVRTNTVNLAGCVEDTRYDIADSACGLLPVTSSMKIYYERIDAADAAGGESEGGSGDGAGQGELDGGAAGGVGDDGVQGGGDDKRGGVGGAEEAGDASAAGIGYDGTGAAGVPLAPETGGLWRPTTTLAVGKYDLGMLVFLVVIVGSASGLCYVFLRNDGWWLPKSIAG